MSDALPEIQEGQNLLFAERNFAKAGMALARAAEILSAFATAPGTRTNQMAADLARVHSWLARAAFAQGNYRACLGYLEKAKAATGPEAAEGAAPEVDAPGILSLSQEASLVQGCHDLMSLENPLTRRRSMAETLTSSTSSTTSASAANHVEVAGAAPGAENEVGLRAELGVSVRKDLLRFLPRTVVDHISDAGERELFLKKALVGFNAKPASGAAATPHCSSSDASASAGKATTAANTLLNFVKLDSEAIESCYLDPGTASLDADEKIWNAPSALRSLLLQRSALPPSGEGLISTSLESLQRQTSLAEVFAELRDFNDNPDELDIALQEHFLPMIKVASAYLEWVEEEEQEPCNGYAYTAPFTKVYRQQVALFCKARLLACAAQLLLYQQQIVSAEGLLRSAKKCMEDACRTPANYGSSGASSSTTGGTVVASELTDRMRVWKSNTLLRYAQVLRRWEKRERDILHLEKEAADVMTNLNADDLAMDKEHQENLTLLGHIALPAFPNKWAYDAAPLK
eukprot:g12636.t1